MKSYFLAASILGALSTFLGGPAAAQTNEIVLANFGFAPDGWSPYSGVRLNRQGNLYGTTEYGGLSNEGVLYRLDTSGAETVLHSFAGGTDGCYPTTAVVSGYGGNLYGVTQSCGSDNAGVVYKLDTTGHYTVVYTFTGGADGGQPLAGLIADAGGNLYGTTWAGGIGGGTIFKIDPLGNETVLYNFSGSLNDGGGPTTGVAVDSLGNLYGTTSNSGIGGGGIFKLDSDGHFTLLYAFGTGASPDGCDPNGITADAKGNLYGTMSSCGVNDNGIVFKFDHTGHYTVLHRFTNAPDGGVPYGNVALDAAGNIYGTTLYGGAAFGGVLFKLDPSGNETILHSFGAGFDLFGPYAGVVLDESGNLYGTAPSKDPAGGGGVFRVDPEGNETILQTFSTGLNGSGPRGSLLADTSGNLYGTTAGGGSFGSGVVYKWNRTGGLKVLYNFTGAADGGQPFAGVTYDASGNLYGTAAYGGTSNQGVVFKLDPSGNQTVLYSFTGGPDGGRPEAGVIRDGAGNLYGTTSSGGTDGSYGVVFKVTTSGRETVLHSFTNGADGGVPLAAVIGDSAGNLYGTASQGGVGGGTVYKIDRTGNFSVLFSFTTEGTDGIFPKAGLLRDSNGNLYGTASEGGFWNGGVAFRLDPAGTATVLQNFNWPVSNPQAGLILDPAGNLYGTVCNAPFGTNSGDVFKLDPAGNETVLHAFTGLGDGSYPLGGLIRDSLGNLYGTASTGGKFGGGVIFVLTNTSTPAASMPVE